MGVCLRVGVEFVDVFVSVETLTDYYGLVFRASFHSIFQM